MGGMIMFGGVFVWRTITTAHMTAFQTQAQMDPPIARFKAIFTARRAGLDYLHLTQMSTGLIHFYLDFIAVKG
jgi:hypothetical protein